MDAMDDAKIDEYLEKQGEDSHVIYDTYSLMIFFTIYSIQAFVRCKIMVLRNPYQSARRLPTRSDSSRNRETTSIWLTYWRLTKTTPSPKKAQIQRSARFLNKLVNKLN